MIEISNLSFAYTRKAAPALNGLDLTLRPGEIFGLLGPSGAGKSTLHHILTRRLRNYAGDVRVLGRSLRRWGADYFHRIGVGFELPNHYEKLTALENLHFFGGLYGRYQDPLPLLERAGLGAAAHQRVSAWSKGMKMRLNVVRALLHDPNILLLDEPTSGLDPVHAHALYDWLEELRDAGKTILLSTHRLHEAGERCDRLGLLKDGRLLCCDHPDALRQEVGRATVKVRYGDAGQHSSEFPLQGLSTEVGFSAILEEQIYSLHSQEASLETVFLKLAGTASPQAEHHDG
ncbi:MAG: ABC transporter ATP-binding protein [Bacteroidota bacterium]